MSGALRWRRGAALLLVASLAGCGARTTVRDDTSAGSGTAPAPAADPEPAPTGIIVDSSGGIVPDTLPPVVIESPSEGERVGSVVRVSGTANVYEAHVGLRVRNARGAIVRDTFATATCGTGCRGHWEASLVLPGPGAEPYAIEAFAPSGEDGRPLHLVRVNVERQRWP